MTRVLRAFWHRTRKVFVPLTTDEVVRRTEATPHEAARALWSLTQQGLLQSRNDEGKRGTTTWNLTDYGKALTAKLIEQQEAIKR